MSSDLSEITKFFTTDPDQLIKLKRRVMEDILPPEGQVDMIYCVGGTVDTQGAALKIGAMLWRGRKGVDIIGVLRGNTDHGYCGFEFCRDQLIEYGVYKRAIVPIDMLFEDSERINTLTEAKALLFHCNRDRGKIIILCAPFFHQIRASSTLISLLNRENPELWVFNLPGRPEWMGRVRHSQGVVEGDLFELLISELGRLFRYHNQGDIRSCAELLAYYDRRDKEFISHG